MVIFDSDIERYGMCRERPDIQCSVICNKFMKAECEGMRYIRCAGAKSWIDQNKNPFPMYKELTNKGVK